MTDFGREAPTHQRRLMGAAAVMLMALVAAVAQSFGRFTYGVLLPAVRDDLGLSNTVASSLATVNMAAYLVGSLIVAAASSRFRLLSVMRIGLALAIIGQALATISPGPAVLGVGLFAQGLGGALTWIPAPVVTADAIAPERRGLAVGFLGAGMGLGVVFAGQLASIVRSTMGDASWRNVYFVQLIIGAVVAAVVLLFIGHRQERLASGTGIGGFSALRRVPGWVPMVSGFVIFGLLYLLVISFLTARLEDDSGWTSSQASLAFTLVGAAMIFGGPLFIALSDRIGARWTLAMSFAGWAITTTLILPGWFVPTIFLSVAVGMLFAAMPTVLTVYVVSNTAADDYGPAFAATTFCFGVAQMISPQLGGFIADAAGSFTPVFLLSAALAVVGMFASLGLPRRVRPSLAAVPAPVPAVAPEPDWRLVNMTFEVIAADAAAEAMVPGPQSGTSRA
ncbi:MAG: YbfB/YjiJ family MFS transporter [Acidimicrobiales bacterium]|nr:YbfB/YjiJ family MFS transporter [Acidimicrobiales bacterium]MYA27433.1 YbfB/YjiJ family MFS transporter [Acidimicrobiales bacterium]MYD33871.1 YbfB/YjiJ family MFS transporter [Acidimicrobiales bacterium]MYD82550.1 YbfB/YjiJ family MFS transporter [Acidimicrobiales bacterium]MYI10425.1 YbfB/YjiJ family MFS transporter [Acidimicrobiales bacterium]